MTDYDALVKSLREKAEFLTVSDANKAPPNIKVKNLFAETMKQAADAIEELSKPLDVATWAKQGIEIAKRNGKDLDELCGFLRSAWCIGGLFEAMRKGEAKDE